MSFGYDFFIGPDNCGTEFAAMKKVLNDFNIESLSDYYGLEAVSITKKIKGRKKGIKKNNRAIKKNIRKSPKKSSEVASGMQAKSTSLEMENEQLKSKIGVLSKEIESIKVKLGAITRN